MLCTGGDLARQIQMAGGQGGFFALFVVGFRGMEGGNLNPGIIMNFLDELIREQGGDVQQQLTSELGLSPEQAAGVLPKVGPLVLGGLKRQMDSHGAGHVENLANNFSAADLGGLLGGRQEEANAHLAQHLGISGSTAAKIIPMLAPIILGALLKKGGSGGAPSAGGGGLGGLGSILDRNGDGSILDDLAGIFMGGRAGQPGGAGGMGGMANKAGCLSAILGGLLKGRR